MSGYGKSITGKIRSTNEDAILVENDAIGALENLYIVADGMGGHLAGEVASEMAIKVMRDYLIENTDCENVFEALTEAVENANESIYLNGINDSEHFGMGTTLLAASVLGKRAYILNVGDSRLYVINKNEDRIEQVTVDHSLVMELLRLGKITEDEAESHPNKNIITRALGNGISIKCDRFTYDMADGDILLLCTDGLSNMISKEDILSVCKEEKEIEHMVGKLLDKANENGGADNISVIIYCGDDGV